MSRLWSPNLKTSGFQPWQFTHTFHADVANHVREPSRQSSETVGVLCACATVYLQYHVCVVV